MIITQLSTSYLDQCRSELSMLELGALLSLVTYVCRSQHLLPLDTRACERIAHAHHRDEQRACGRVLALHFDITEHGRSPRPGLLYASNHAQFQSATDETATVTPASLSLSHPDNAQQLLPGVTLDDTNAVRQKRYRARLATLRDEVLAQGNSPRKGASKQELLDMLRVTPDETASVTPVTVPRPSRASAGAGNTNTNTNTNIQERESSVTLSANGAQGGAAVLAMKAAGMPAGNPSSPRLHRLLAAGVSLEELADTVRDCVAAHKPLGFNYLLAVVEGERRDAAAKAAVAAAQPRGLEKWGGPELMAMLGKRSTP